MKKIVVILLLWGACGLARAVTAPTKVYPPFFLRTEDKVPTAALDNPGEPVQRPGDPSENLEENPDAPDPSTMRRLAAPDFFEKIKKSKNSEKSLSRFYWHRADALDYCHYRDREGNNWYGWTSGGNFNWVLWRGSRYWWRDGFAGHWLYYHQGNWWRADNQDDLTAQVLVDGEYFLCDKDGKILKDMGQDGEGGIVSAPGRYQGDFHHGGHGGNHGNHSSNPGSGQAPANSQPSSPASP